MIQFYFLSILFNLLTGLILVYCKDLTVGDDLDDASEIINSETTFKKVFESGLEKRF